MEPLSDPMNDRVVKSVPIPPHRPLTAKLMYPDSSKEALDHIYPLGKPDVPNVATIRKHIVDQGTIGRAELIKLIRDVTALLSKY
jgi:serine/threonine-protein phosphatase 2B catalytic subunit